jgi:hypothetical protein
LQAVKLLLPFVEKNRTVGHDVSGVFCESLPQTYSIRVGATLVLREEGGEDGLVMDSIRNTQCLPEGKVENTIVLAVEKRSRGRVPIGKVIEVDTVREKGCSDEARPLFPLLGEVLKRRAYEWLQALLAQGFELGTAG